MANSLLISEVFAGVNYMDNLAKNEAKTPFQLNDALLGATNQGYLQHNVSSIINKFTVFQYAALNAGGSYRAEGHFIGFSSRLQSDADYVASSRSKTIAQITALNNRKNAAKLKGNADLVKEIEARIKLYQTSDSSVSAAARKFNDISTDILSNPTAGRLIKWGAEVSGATAVGFQPYSYTDFMYCKHYGKIPNNRLITLRRYPFPIGDSLRLGGNRRNAIPVAQAVTWFGGETGNTLNSLGVFSWDIPWRYGLDAVDGPTGQTITGNEITLNDLLKLVTDVGPGGKQIAAALTAAYVGTVGGDASMSQASGYEGKIQEYQKNLYDQTSGPYWNRIYGPVNVITKSSMRLRGLQNTYDSNPISLKFQYSFRSFNGMSPKIAALEIISNFMNLTYQDAQFLGQLARYFPKLGVKFDPTTTEAIGNILTSWGSTHAGNNSEEFSTILANLIGAAKLAGSKIVSDPLGTGAKVLQAGLMRPDLLGNAIPELISIKSALSDRPVGEWHITVGNPMNPIFVMGDLICSEVKMAWDDEIGPDDFPTGVTFTVTLKQGKPRDKTAIERMLNHGQTKLTAGALRTSSQADTFGDKNNELFKTVTDSATYDLKLADTFKNLTGDANTGTKSAYLNFRNRFLKGYGFTPPTKEGFANDISAFGKAGNGNIDDSLLLLYYQRQYGNN
jgi:hypothetical protein